MYIVYTNMEKQGLIVFQDSLSVKKFEIVTTIKLGNLTYKHLVLD